MELTCDLCSKTVKSLVRGEWCSACHTAVRRHAVKSALVAELGGACAHCGFCGHYSAFDFHHTEGKEVTISEAIANCNTTTLRAELSKCSLVCSNCHRGEHARKGVSFRAAVDAYEFRAPSRTFKCEECGVGVTHGSSRCIPCSARHRTRIAWPTDKALLSMVHNSNMNQVAAEMGVAYNSVKKRVKKIKGS